MRPPSSRSCKSVLIVDDNPWIRKVLCERFQREAGLAVCGEAENGREAIEKDVIVACCVAVSRRNCFRE